MIKFKKIRLLILQNLGRSKIQIFAKYKEPQREKFLFLKRQLNPSQKPICSIPFFLKSGNLTFCLDIQLLAQLQNYQAEPRFHESYLFKIPSNLRFFLLQNFVGYGFVFLTRYKIEFSDLKSVMNPDLKQRCSLQEEGRGREKNIFQTSISLDGDSFNQISRYCYDCLENHRFRGLFSTHYWLIGQVLQTLYRQVDQFFTVSHAFIDYLFGIFTVVNVLNFICFPSQWLKSGTIQIVIVIFRFIFDKLLQTEQIKRLMISLIWQLLIQANSNIYFNRWLKNLLAKFLGKF